MEKKKKICAEPKLTALVRRKPEEGVLDACKITVGGGGPANGVQGCHYSNGCAACQASGNS